jgi:hypothetical protein
MGAVLGDCNSPGGVLGSSDNEFGPGGDVKIVLRVDHALVHDRSGADVSGFKTGDQIVMCSLTKDKKLSAAGWRYTDHQRRFWPQSYRFQVQRDSYMAEVLSRDGKIARCVVQVPRDLGERTMDNAILHVEDAELATAHASRFNEQMAKSMGNILDYRDQGETAPTLKVCAPVACEVLASSAPEALPRGSACTVTAWPHKEVSKFVFDGSEDFLEVPQAYFHWVAYASGGLEFVCDIQGAEDDDGGFHILDPVMLREDRQDVTSFLNSTFREVKKDPSKKLGPDHAPTEDRFDRLHARCGQMCQSFDPMRRGAKGKKGLCGINVTCMS